MNLDYQLIDSIPVSIYWKDLEGVYLGCNKYMLKMAGFEDRSELIGKTDYQLPWYKQADKIREIDQLVITNNKTYKIEETPEVHNGDNMIFLSSKSPLLDLNDIIIGIVGISIDITDRIEIQHLGSKSGKFIIKHANKITIF